jgi:hypothetical protein
MDTHVTTPKLKGKTLKLSLGLINYARSSEDVRDSGGIAPPFLTSALDGGEWSASHPCYFTARETAHGTHCTGGRVGHRDGLDVMEKRKISCPYRETNLDPSVAQPVAWSLYRLSYHGYLSPRPIPIKLHEYILRSMI